MFSDIQVGIFTFHVKFCKFELIGVAIILLGLRTFNIAVYAES